MNQSSRKSVGIDVSKSKLDVAVVPENESWSTANEESGIDHLVKRLKALRPRLIVLEATGGLEMPVVANPEAYMTLSIFCEWRRGKERTTRWGLTAFERP